MAASGNIWPRLGSLAYLGQWVPRDVWPGTFRSFAIPGLGPSSLLFIIDGEGTYLFMLCSFFFFFFN